jgi:hypothetical protein
MSTQAKQASIVCELCGCTQNINYRDQARRFCSSCSRKLAKVAVKVQQELDTQKAEAKAKIAKKPKVIHLHCDTCGRTFRCPVCSPAPKKVKVKATPKKRSKPVKKVKKPVVKRGAKNAKKK